MYSNIWKETLGIKVYLLWLSALTSIVTQLFKVVAFHFGLILIPITLASLMLFLLPFLGPKLPRIPCFPYLSCLGLLTWHYLSWVISKVNCTPRHFFFLTQLSEKYRCHMWAQVSFGHMIHARAYYNCEMLLISGFNSWIKVYIVLKCLTIMSFGSMTYCSNFKVIAHIIVADIKP